MCIDILPADTSVCGCQIPWSWTYRPSYAAVWVLGIETRSSGRAARVLKH